MRRLASIALVSVACGGTPRPVPPAPPPPPAKTVQVNETGADFDVDAVTLAGYVTVVDFWSESCGACVVVGNILASGVADQPKVVIRKIDVGDGDTPVGHAYQIGALPHYNVYDKQRKLRYVLVGNDCLKTPDIARQLAAE